LASKRPAFSENIHRLFDEAQATDLAPGIVSLIESRATHAQIREVPVVRIQRLSPPNFQMNLPRTMFRSART